MDDINKLNSSFFSGSSIQPGITSRIASQDNAKRAVKDTEADDTQPKLYEKTQTNQPTQISFSNAIGQAKATIANLDPNAIKGMNQADAIKYTRNSIADLDKKMAQVANLSSMADSSKVQNNPNQAPIVAPNTQVSNSVSNVTNITSDFLRNITASYRTTPQWRDLQG